jgi:hypothetical protein
VQAVNNAGSRLVVFGFLVKSTVLGGGIEEALAALVASINALWPGLKNFRRA